MCVLLYNVSRILKNMNEVKRAIIVATGLGVKIVIDSYEELLETDESYRRN